MINFIINRFYVAWDINETFHLVAQLEDYCLGERGCLTQHPKYRDARTCSLNKIRVARISGSHMHMFENGMNFGRVILTLMLIAHHEREHANTTFASLEYTPR